ncbi:MAG: hypothetical protein K0R54_310 [Clostridiaceae bacterium]|nr:hypothetical protein [Clostridiaceae bacterium]
MVKKFNVLSILCLLLIGFSFKVNAETVPTYNYVVKSGDSLWKIAQLNETGISELVMLNPQISDPALIYTGSVLKVPDIREIKNIENNVIKLVNVERQKRGIAPLKANWQLSRVARYKSQDMRDKKYFSHTSPTYGTPFVMIRNFGLSFTTAGENIAMGQTSAEQVMNSWMNSAGHRNNILNPNFSEIGVGYASGYYWTEMFIRR